MRAPADGPVGALFRCDGCDSVRMLFVRLDRGLVCASCWKKAGSPWIRTAWEVA